MSQIQFANNAITTLAGAISAIATSLSVAPGTGALFPIPAAGQSFKITLTPASGDVPAPEIMLVTGVSTDAFTVVRGQEGTTAQAWGVGSVVANLLTAQTEDSYLQVQYYAGNPNGNVAGFVGTSTTAPSACWDITDGLMYICTGSGNAAAATWVALAPIASPTFTGTPSAPTPATSDNTTRLATTAFTQAGLALKAMLAGSSSQAFSVANAVSSSQAVALGQIVAPAFAYQNYSGTAGSHTINLSLTAGGPGILFAVGAISKAGVDSSANPTHLSINGSVLDSDNNTLSITNAGAVSISAGGSQTAAWSGGTTTVPYTLRLLFVFIPNI